MQVRHFTWIAVFLENGRVVSKSSNLDGGSFKYKRIIPSTIEMTDLTGVWATVCVSRASSPAWGNGIVPLQIETPPPPLHHPLSRLDLKISTPTRLP